MEAKRMCPAAQNTTSKYRRKVQVEANGLLLAEKWKKSDGHGCTMNKKSGVLHFPA
jgi:hypothetical protein